MERSRHRLHPSALMAMLMGTAFAAAPTPMPDGRPNRQKRQQPKVSTKVAPVSRSKYKRHQGSKECARRLKQQARLAA